MFVRIKSITVARREGELPKAVEMLITCRMLGTDSTQWREEPAYSRFTRRVVRGVTQSGRVVKAEETAKDDEDCRWSFEASFGDEGSSGFAQEVAEALADALPESGEEAYVVVTTDFPLPRQRRTREVEYRACELRDVLAAQNSESFA